MKVALLDTGRNALARAQAYGTKIKVASYDIGSKAAISSILSVTVNTSGHGFTTEPPVIVQGDGSGAVLKAVMSGDQISDIIVQDPGTGYTFANVVIGGSGSGATATAKVGVRSNLTTVQNPVYVNGPASDINAQFVSPNEFRYIITLNEAVGDFNIGNILLKLEDGTPFLMGSLDQTLPKMRTNPPITPVGDRLALNLTLKYSNVAGLVIVEMTDTVYMNPPSVPTIEDLPPAGESVFDLYIVDNDARLARPTLAFRKNSEPGWYGLPFTEELFSGSFGPALDGGVGQEDPYAIGSRRVTGGGGYVRYGARAILSGGNYSETPVQKRNFGVWG